MTGRTYLNALLPPVTNGADQFGEDRISGKWCFLSAMIESAAGSALSLRLRLPSPPPSHRPPHEQQYDPRKSEQQAGDSEAEQPPGVEILMVLPVHDV